MKIGTTQTERSVSCHERISIATRVEETMTTFETMLETVLVTTVWTPPTSFASRDWISPVRVAVKKRSDMRCRCA